MKQLKHFIESYTRADVHTCLGSSAGVMPMFTWANFWVVVSTWGFGAGTLSALEAVNSSPVIPK